MKLPKELVLMCLYWRGEMMRKERMARFRKELSLIYERRLVRHDHEYLVELEFNGSHVWFFSMEQDGMSWVADVDHHFTAPTNLETMEPVWDLLLNPFY